MKAPLVSVKMITYNHAPYITQAIEGVLLQKTNFPFEIVIGEDCSTDGTREIVLDYKKKYPNIISVISSKKNVGAKENSYRTISACRGKYVAYCEGDDFWHKTEKLQKQVDYLETHPECGLVYSDYDVIFVNSNKKITNYLQYSGRPVTISPGIQEILLGKARILTCSVVVRRKLVIGIINADLYLHKSNDFLMGDTQLWSEIAVISKLHYIDESLATHNILSESATQSRDKAKRLRFWISNAEMCIYLCKKYRLPGAIREQHEDNLKRKSLQLSFYEKNLYHAEKVKNNSKNFSFKDRIWYLGVKYPILKPLIIGISVVVHIPDRFKLRY